MIKKGLIILSSTLLFSGCAMMDNMINKKEEPKQTSSLQQNGEPMWLIDPYMDGDEVAAVGCAHRTMKGESDQKKLAISRAKDQIAAQVKTKVDNVTLRRKSINNGRKTSSSSDSSSLQSVEGVNISTRTKAVYKKSSGGDMCMGSSKIKIALVAAGLLIGSTNLSALTFEEFAKEQNANYTQYKDTMEKEFAAYQKAYEDAFKEFSKELGKKWPDKEPDVTTKKKWVEYSKDLNSKKSVDYEKKEINLEVIASSEKEAQDKIEKMFNEVVNKDVKQAVKDDILEKKIAKKLKKPRVKVKSNQKLIADIINAQEKRRLKQELEKQKLKVVKHNGKFIYKANVKLPSDTTVRKAKEFKNDVLKNASKQQIPPELIYAIMHSESSFNPMARSHIPAFGLMQIVPKTAGVDSYQYLYKKKKVLSSSYLYESNKNITIGSAYLHILYYRYLKKIKDPQSRLYCAIAAYNTGAGNVAKAFIGSTNISRAANKINSMSSKAVYDTLMKKLPYNETKHYLKKVTTRASAYNKLLKTTL